MTRETEAAEDPRSQDAVDVSDAEAVALSKDLRRRGWTFVGPTTVYAFMQAMGLVNDHLEGCIARQRVDDARASLSRPVA